MQTYEGRCKYCGQIRSILAKSQEEADYEISKNCDCKGAEIETKKVLVQARLKGLAGEAAPETGFAPIEPEIYEEIEAMAMRVTEGKIKTMTLKVDGTTLSVVNNGGKIKVVRKKTYEQGGNIE